MTSDDLRKLAEQVRDGAAKDPKSKVLDLAKKLQNAVAQKNQHRMHEILRAVRDDLDALVVHWPTETIMMASASLVTPGVARSLDRELSTWSPIEDPDKFARKYKGYYFVRDEYKGVMPTGKSATINVLYMDRTNLYIAKNVPAVLKQGKAYITYEAYSDRGR